MDKRELLPPGPGWALTPAEKQLISFVADGRVWFPRVGVRRRWNRNPADASSWPVECEVRAEVIRCLVCGVPWSECEKPWYVHPKGLRLLLARIKGNLDLAGCELLFPLKLTGCSVEGSVNLESSRTQSISMRRSRVECVDACDVEIHGDLRLSRNFTALRGADLSFAKIDGQLICTEGKFYSREGSALDASGITVGLDVQLDHGFVADGEVDFTGATIGGQLVATKGAFAVSSTDELAMSFDSASIGADAFLDDGFRAIGSVDFVGTKIAGDLRLQGGEFRCPSGTALRLEGARIGGALFLSSKTNVDGTLNLEQAEVAALRDGDCSWLKSGTLVLDGFSYRRLFESATDWKSRLEWLRRQPVDHLGKDFRPQPWAHLISVLKEMGYDRDARKIAVEREKAMACRQDNGRLRRLLDWLRRYTVGYGYRPGFALWWSLGVFVICWLTFASAANLGYMVPSAPGMVTYLAQRPNASVPDSYTDFNAAVYALDVYLPVIELGQDATWAPTSTPHGDVRALSGTDGFWTCVWRLGAGRNSDRVPGGPNRRSCGFSADQSPLSWPARFIAEPAFKLGVHRFVYWLEQIFGWIFVSLYIAGMSGIMKRE